MNSTHHERETPRAFSSVDRLYGPGAHVALERAAILVVGIGGVGSWATEALARNGVGRIAGHQRGAVLSSKAIQGFNAGACLPVFFNRFKDIG